MLWRIKNNVITGFLSKYFLGFESGLEVLYLANALELRLSCQKC